ncbi:MAG: alpha/beta hydrolase [Planctomycetota bacterium]|nr:MAG: alpha/beta hydrolase [Planctomycetota bacterium]
MPININSEYIQLSQGTVRYLWLGKDNSIPLILIHGLSGPMEIWKPSWEPLIEKGFSLLCYDLYGRGRSQNPSLPHNPKLYIQQLQELIERLDFPRPFLLTGLSMGGIVASHFAEQFSSWLQGLVLVAPAGFLPLPWWGKLILLPIVGETAMLTFFPLLHYWNSRKGFSKKENWLEFYSHLKPSFALPSYRKAILSTLRNMPLGDRGKTFQNVGKLPFPKLVIWGRKDKILPFYLSQKVLESLGEADLACFEEGSHSIPHEEPEKFAQMLFFFYQKKIQ